MDLHDFTDEQIAFLCEEFNLTPYDLTHMDDHEVQVLYDKLCDMEGEMAGEILSIMDME